MSGDAGRGRARGALPGWPGAIAAVLVTAFVWAPSGGLAGLQEAPVVEPGSVATVPVSVGAPDGFRGGEADYRVEEVTGIQLFGPRRGTVPVEDGSAVVALTFQAGEDLAAGRREVARVVVSWGGGASDTADVQVRVPDRHRLETGFLVSSATVAPGRETEIGYRVANRGNTVDTVRLRVDDGGAASWRFVPRRSRLALAAGRADTVPVRVHAPADVRIGTVRRVRLVASGLESSTSADATFRVVEQPGWVPGVEHVPGRVFVGSATGRVSDATAGVLASVQAGGTVGAETDLRLDAHYRPDGLVTPRPLREEIVGPSARLRIRRPDWEASLGDVFAVADPLAGSFLGGRGGDVRWTGDDYFGEVFVARPTGGLGRGGGGHSVMAAGGLRFENGRAGIVVADHRLGGESPGLGAGRTQSVGGRLRLGSRSSRFLRVEAGLLRVSPDAGQPVTGPAAEGQLWLTGEDGYLNVRGRAVPGQVAGGPTLGDEIFAGGQRRIAGPLHALARLSLASGEQVTGGNSDLRRAEAGLAFSPAGFRLAARLRHEDAEIFFPEDGTRTRQSFVLSTDAPLGPLQVDARAEVGREETPTRRSGFSRVRGTLRWQGADAWAWLSGGQETAVTGGARPYLEAEGGWEGDRVELAGGLSLESGPFGPPSVEGWSRVTYRLTGDLAVVGGLERDAGVAGRRPWRVSLGVERALDLPLPVPSTPVAHGVVFEDRDGDGRRDAGEPGLPGVRLQKGFVEVVTDQRGRFEIRQEAVRSRSLAVDAGSLPGDAMVTPGVEIPRQGEVAVPVLRTSRLVLSVFLDADGDGRRDEGEAPAEGAVVTATGPEGRRRVAEVDAGGRAAVNALRPGPYRVRVEVAGTRRFRAAEREFRVRLSSGAAVTRRVPVERERRPLR